MAINLNLLPQEYSVKSGLGAVIKVVWSLTIVLLVVFLVFVLGVSGFFFISSSDLNRVSANVDSLKNQVKAQETTEQRLVLLKDRLGKIKGVQSQSSLSKSLADIDSVLGTVSGGTVGELNVTSLKTDASVVFGSSQGLGDFFKNLISSDKFNSIIMTSFGFNPITGYLVSLKFVGK